MNRVSLDALTDRSRTGGLVRAIVLDVDGTLYQQDPVRRAMLWRLLVSNWRQPGRGIRTLRLLSAYRQAQESLRHLPASNVSVGRQLELAAAAVGADLATARSYVSRWMEQEPLEVLARSVDREVARFLRTGLQHGLCFGAWSDYPATAKLAAMGLADSFAVTVSAQDAEVQRFKPDPRGLEVALRRLGVDREQALYVGDRPELDGLAAANAGVACVILRRRNQNQGERWLGVSGFRELQNVLGW